LTFYGDSKIMCKYFASNINSKRTGSFITTLYRFSPETFSQKHLVPHTGYSSPATFLFHRLKIPPFWHNWGEWGRISGCAKHPHRIQLPECI
jgi:hypothetical protein